MPNQPAQHAGENRDPADRLSDALEACSVFASTQALEVLVSSHPGSWRGSISRLRALPDPARPDVAAEEIAERCQTLAAAARQANSQGQMRTEDARWLRSVALETTRAANTFANMRMLLKSLNFFQDSISTQTFRLGILIEHQSRLANKLARDAGRFEQGYNPYAAFGAFQDGRTSIVDSYENLVECVELVLRYSHFTADKVQRDGQLNPIDPFDDPDLERVVRAAEIWNSAVEELGAVKFVGWWTHSGGDHACYSPSDLEEYIRYRAGHIREQAIQAQFFSQEVLSRVHSDSLEALRSLAASLVVPDRGQTWNGVFSVEALRAATADPVFADQADQWIELRHYTPYADSVSIPPLSLRWRTWLHAVNALKVFSHAFSIAVQPDMFALPNDIAASVLVANPNNLAQVLEAAGLRSQDALEAINALTFSQRKRSLELWDQPLLPLSEHRVLMVPGLVEGGNPARMLENAISEWGARSPGMRGIPFEQRIQNEIGMLCPGRAQRKVIIYDDRGAEVEFDIVWWWAGHLFLIETKCLRSVHSFAEFTRAREDVTEALRQLRRRRQEVASHWQEFRRSATDLDLPDLCPSPDCVITIALTNILDFTTWETPDGIVADDFVFRRYFGDPRIEVWMTSPGEPDVFVADRGQIRAGPPSPQEFLRYLRLPPQWVTVRDRIDLEMVSSISTHKDFPVWSLVGVYRPDLKFGLHS